MSQQQLFVPRNPGDHPPALSPGYKSSLLRAPAQPLLRLEPTASETRGPRLRREDLGALDHDLILNSARGGLPIGERLLIHGVVLDEQGRPQPNVLIEVWQANAGGRYRHPRDQYLAPLDPHFGGCGRTLTDEQGHYRFLTIRPGAYPWPNHRAEWRPAHIHFSLAGEAWCQRLVTQMYFEGDPLIQRCPIVHSIASEEQIRGLVARYDPAADQAMDLRAYRWDIILRGRQATLFEEPRA
ncbi:protocatechuate 3,4-dioxygenase subunit beta [Pelomonas sp. SE-A7]|uniref:protocatechuate 3,4-dioxygenase subunit beta n=1 Tax=Pelomonas sp. SE-A7 TaxID=3054953 RepID=UPI00259CA337|nr:protocatechuate 3,4-dioxygenase subunit beta [Pelomonas sp. SE-A7]MDM4768534.1 protocatechuate 3,4-dioxygenase subunit beta [Pelomonas sp. SE-A7]